MTEHSKRGIWENVVKKADLNRLAQMWKGEIRGKQNAQKGTEDQRSRAKIVGKMRIRACVAKRK
jgi:hypothetical protein